MGKVIWKGWSTSHNQIAQPVSIIMNSFLTIKQHASLTLDDQMPSKFRPRAKACKLSISSNYEHESDR
jgi:hypothetical protein